MSFIILLQKKNHIDISFNQYEASALPLLPHGVPVLGLSWGRDGL